jgi:hypothetical protein
MQVRCAYIYMFSSRDLSSFRGTFSNCNITCRETSQTPPIRPELRLSLFSHETNTVQRSTHASTVTFIAPGLVIRLGSNEEKFKGWEVAQGWYCKCVTEGNWIDLITFVRLPFHIIRFECVCLIVQTAKLREPTGTAHITADNR